MELFGRIERRFCVAVADELDADEEAAAANVADMRMLAKPRLQSLHQELALTRHLRQQVLLIDDTLYCQLRGAGRGVSHVGMPMQEATGALGNGIGNLAVNEQRADRLITGAQA